LAAILEHLNDKEKHTPKKYSSTRSDSKGSFSASELWKARQLREYRRANNLCFKCGEKYSPSHSCATSAPTLNVMEKVAVDGGEFLPDDLLDALDSPNIHLM
jgi:ribosomal protein L32